MIYEPEISVIVPVYNVEKWLSKCLDSILGQTYGDFELILVNDGSTDGSLRICREYEARDARIKVIDGPNRGSSAARNAGLENARGKWIIFCDSDDWWDLQLLEKLHTAAIENDADIAACNIVWEYTDKSVEEKYAYGPIETDRDKCFVGTVYCSLCNKLVRSSLFRDYDIKGNPGTAMWDDVYMSARLRFYSRLTVIIDESMYHYNRLVDSSQILKFKSANFEHIEQIGVTNKLENYFRENCVFDDTAKGIICGCQLFLYSQIGDVEKWRYGFISPIFSWSTICRLSKSKKEEIRFLCSILLPVSICKVVRFCFRFLSGSLIKKNYE